MLKTLCQCSFRAGLNCQPISVSIHKVWTNQKLEVLALALSKSVRIASFLKSTVVIDKRNRLPIFHKLLAHNISINSANNQLLFIC